MTEKKETSSVPDSSDVKDDTRKSTKDQSELSQVQETQVKESLGTKEETTEEEEETTGGRGPTLGQEGPPKGQGSSNTGNS